MNFQKLMVATTLSALVAIAACSDSGEKQTSTAENDSAPAQVQIEADQPTTDSAEGASVDAADSSKPLDTETLSVRMGDSAPMTVEAMKAAVSAGGNADEIATRYVAGVERYAVLTQAYRDLVAGPDASDADRTLYAAVAKAAHERFDTSGSALLWGSVLARGFGIAADADAALGTLDRADLADSAHAKYWKAVAMMDKEGYDAEVVKQLLTAADQGGVAGAAVLLQKSFSQ